MRVVAVVVLALAAAACVLAYDANQIEVKFGNRNFYVVHPEYSTNPKPGLIMWYHGYGQWCAGQNEWCDKWQANLKKIGLNFMCAAVCGEGGGWDVNGNKDIDLTKQIIDYMAKNYNVDTSKVFASGWSYGGMFSAHLACATGTSIVQGISPHCCAQQCNAAPIHYLGYNGVYDNVCAGSVTGSWESFLKAQGCGVSSGDNRQVVCKGKQYEFHSLPAPHVIMDYTAQGPAWIRRALSTSPPPPAAPACGSTQSEGESLTISCPAGQVMTSVDFASFGNPAGDCSYGLVASSVCHAANSSAVVSKACVGQNKCTVAGTVANFGDPCSGNNKRLAVKASCSGSTPTTDVTCAVADENKAVDLSCAANKKIAKVNFASYGLPQGNCNTSFSTGTCHSDKSQSVVEAACVGKSTCSVAATNDVFGDPCVGTGKQLAVSVTCA